jgi:hypothetical protein
VNESNPSYSIKLKENPMKKSFARTLVALAIAAVLCSAAWADDKSKSEPGASGAQATVSGKQTQNGNAVNNEIVDNNATIDGDHMKNAKGNLGVNISGGANNQQANEAALSAVDAQFVFGAASTSSEQKSTSLQSRSLATHNSAQVAGSALSGAQGNINVNVTAGNGNQQRNELAVAVGKSASGASATVAGVQEITGNSTTSTGQLLTLTNETTVTLQGNLTGTYSGTMTPGNGGGSSSGGSNAGGGGSSGGSNTGGGGGTAPGSGSSGGGVPSNPGNGSGSSGNAGNTGSTGNTGSAGGAASNPIYSGGNTGTSNPVYQTGTGTTTGQSGGTVAGDPLHPSPTPQIPNLPCDPLNCAPAPNPTPNPTPTPSGGNYSEAGTTTLSGSFTGKVVSTTTTYRPHVNNAALGGSALKDAQGNIGVNISAGSGNQQRNSLAISGTK